MSFLIISRGFDETKLIRSRGMGRGKNSSLSYEGDLICQGGCFCRVRIGLLCLVSQDSLISCKLGFIYLVCKCEFCASCMRSGVY